MKVSDSIKEIFFDILSTKLTNNYLIILNLEWQNIVGQNLALTSYPIKIKLIETSYYLLEIAVQSNIIGLQLHYEEQILLDKINFYLGLHNIINKIKIVNRPDLWQFI